MYGETPDETPHTRLVYGDVQDGLVFVDEEEAHDLARLHRALERAKTWGEFRAQAPPRWYEAAVERLREQVLDEGEDDEDDAHEEPSPEQGFDAEEIPGHLEGDWPGFPHMSMEYWVPGEVQDRFGSMVPTAISGDFLQLSPEHEDEIVSAMRRHGYECVRDDDLVWKASGYG